MLSWWLPCWLPTLMSVRCLLYTFHFSRLVRWWATALCLAILRPIYCCIERVSVAKYLYRLFGIMCNWGWCMCVGCFNLR